MIRRVSVLTALLTVIPMLSLCGVGPSLAVAQTSDAPERRPRLGGPQAVQNQIELDRRTRKTELYAIPFLQPYFGWKDELARKYGFAFAFDYTPVVLKSNDSLPNTDDDAASGIFRMFGSWGLLGRGSETVGTLVYRFGHHHSYSDTTPSNFALSNLGYVGVINPISDDRGWNLSNLFWQQSWKSGRFILRGGYHDVADFIEVYALADPFKHFANLAFLTGAGTIGVPSAGSLGVFAGAWVNDNIYLQGGLTDSNGDSTDPLDGFDTFINDHEYFTYLEIGWTTAPERAYLDNIHLTLTHAAERDDAGTEEGWGAVVSVSHYLQNRYLPFVKAGYAHDGSSLLEKSVSAGIGYQPHPIGNELGNLLVVGLNWGKPNSAVFGSGLDDQYTIEVFYRWQVSKELAVTPDIQYLNNPALNAEKDNIWVFGIRGRLVL